VLEEVIRRGIHRLNNLLVDTAHRRPRDALARVCLTSRRTPDDPRRWQAPKVISPVPRQSSQRATDVDVRAEPLVDTDGAHNEPMLGYHRLTARCIPAI